MFAQSITIGFVVLFGAMLPGPDFAIVVKNTFFHSRRSGFFTSLGVASAILIHMSYCLLGLALVISQSLFFFNLIKYTGALYLMYLGIQTLLSKQPKNLGFSQTKTGPSDLSPRRSFWQGFLTNLLNPKATLFFLALFTVLIKPETPFAWELVYALEIPTIALLWFCSLTCFLSHRRVKSLLQKAEPLIAKLLGLILLGFGLALVFLNTAP